MSRHQLSAGLGFSLAGAFFSALYLFPYKRASELAPAGALALGLLSLAAVLNTGLAGIEWRLTRREPARDRKILLATSAFLALLTVTGNYCAAQAVGLLSPPIASVLLRTEVVFVGLAGAVVLKERPSAALVLGAVTALAGLLVMQWPVRLDATAAGAGWALGAALSFGLMQVTTRRVIHRIAPVAVNMLRLWMSVVLMLSLPGLAASAAAPGWDFWGLLGLAALFGPCLGRLCIMFSLRTWSAAHSALLLLLAPVFAFAIGYVGWQIRPSGSELAGAALMLLGVGLPSWAALRERQLAETRALAGER